MKLQLNVYRMGLLILGLGWFGCQSAPPKTKQTVTKNSMIAESSRVVSDPLLWKIPPRPAQETEQLAPLEEINRLFRETYATARSEVQLAQGTVVLARTSGATLFRNGKIVETARVIPSEYLNLRYAAHIPFMIFLKLDPHCGSPLDADTLAELENYITVVKTAIPALVYTKLSETQLLRQHRILDDALAFLHRTLDHGTIGDAELKRYARAASMDMEQNMREAGAAQVNGLHEQMLKWRKQIPDSEWKSMRFIVHGPQQPRGGSAMTLYFSALLKDPGDGRGYLGESPRLVYREDTSLPPNTSPSDPWEADLQLLAAVELDSIASDAFFSDPDRLTVDIVSDGARARIRQLDFSQLQ